MLDAPLDAWYTWVGLSIVSVIVLGLVLGMPRARAPDADRIAGAVDEVATSEYSALERISIAADAIRLQPQRVSLRGDGTVSHATLSVGRLTPVGNGSLRAVLDGRRPSTVFDSPAAFERAVRSARRAESTWRTAVATLTIRRVSWGTVSATLAG